jgi:hypothetical protein
VATKKDAAATKATVQGDKSTRDLYTGMSGQFVAMSEFLWRGYNVAIPAVDAGEDIFVVEAAEGVLRRVQVKTAGTGTRGTGTKTVRFKLSRGQLNLALGGSELFFMLLARWDDVDPRVPWRFILIRRSTLNDLRLNPPPGRRRPKADTEASDGLLMEVVLSATEATAWGHSLVDYLDRWSADWPVGSPMRARAQKAAVTLAAPIGPSSPAHGRPPAATSGLGTTRSRSAR